VCHARIDQYRGRVAYQQMHKYHAIGPEFAFDAMNAG
jgi:hypothetical protein